MSKFDPAFLLATWFGCGLLPKAPGTWGSLAALPVVWVVAVGAGSPGVTVFVVIVGLAGIWAAGRYAAAIGRQDPGSVVIDEVAGQALALVAVAPDPMVYGFAFALFRLFDILKPWPISWADRKVRGGLGIMLDDILAGVACAPLVWAFDTFVAR